MKWIYGLLCLFFLILFHEFGHFIAAKIFGVKVEAFSIGFGPVLLHKKIKGTDFRLSASKTMRKEISGVSQWLMNPTSIRENAGSILGLTQQVKDLALP